MVMYNSKYANKCLFQQFGLMTAAAVAVIVASVLIGGFTLTPSYGQATSTTEQFTQPFESSGLPLCGGEEVRFSGTANFVYHETVLPGGESQITQFHMNYMHATAVGLISGKTFIITETDNGGSTQVGAQTYRTVINGNILTPGAEGTNTGITLVINTTFNANGQPTSEVYFENIRCVG
jgi:hypothetical protein